MLKIQEFVSCFGSIEEANIYLKRELQLKIESSCLYSPTRDVKIYTYNKGRHSDIDNPLVREANGLVLDKDCSLVTKGLDHHYKIKKVRDLPARFRLYKSNATEMTTGMMITVFNYNGVWNVANKDSINDVDYGIDVKRAINDRIEGYWTSIFDDISIPSKSYIYVFDFISSKYESIWPCTTFRLYLLTVLDGDTGKELTTNKVDIISERLGFARPEHKQITGKRSLASFIAKTKIPVKGVILDDGNIRVKLLNTLHYSVKAAIEAKHDIKPIHIAKIFLACNDKVDLTVVTNAFPEYKDFLDLFSKTINKTWQDLVVIWTSIKEFSEDPVTFAHAVPVYPLSHLLFMFRDKQITSLLAGVKAMPGERLVNITKDKYEEEFSRYTRHLKTDYAYENQGLSNQVAK